MRKIAVVSLLMILALVFSSTAFAASVSHSFSPIRASPGETVTVTITASGVPTGEIFTLEDTVPNGWLVSNWQVQGAQETRENIDYRFVAADNRHGWSFTAASSTVTITYTAKAPATVANGDVSFNAIYFDSTGQGKASNSVTVRTITCGDGVCEGGENTNSCSADCAAPAAPAPQVPPTPEATPEASAVVEGDSSSRTTIAFAVFIVAMLAAFFLYARSKKPGASSIPGPRKK